MKLYTLYELIPNSMKVIYLQFRKVWLFIGLLTVYATVNGQISVTGKVTAGDDNQAAQRPFPNQAIESSGLDTCMIE